MRFLQRAVPVHRLFKFGTFLETYGCTIFRTLSILVRRENSLVRLDPVWHQLGRGS
jgi:hypothetical protein